VTLLLVEEGQFLLGTLMRADVPDDRAGPDDDARLRPHGVDHDVHVQQVFGAGPAQGLVVVDLLAAPDAGQQRVDLALVPGRGEHRDVPADRFLCGVAVHARRCRVPERDRPVERLGEDRIRGRLDDQRELGDALLARPALADVAHGGRHQQAVAGLQRAEADLDRELAAVAAPPAGLEPGAHRAHLQVPGVPPAMRRMIPAKPLGHEHVDRAAQQFRARIAEQRLGLLVDQPDRSGLVDDHHGDGRRLQQRPERLLGAGRPLARVRARWCRGRLHTAVAPPGGHRLTAPSRRG
jgi:hypothetical protein